MTDEPRAQQFDRVREQFLQLCDLEGDELAARLEELGRTAPRVREEVEQLLELDVSSESQIRLGVDGQVTSLAPGFEQVRLERIGPHRVVGRLGEGGMGIVYLGEQDNPARQVAIKVLRAGLLDDRGRRRFRAEVDALARFDHPAIARIYDAGIADLGFGEQPYYVMELVQGERLMSWSEGRSLDERLEVFLEVCRAIDHAHRRGVLHRDLKPDNILVTPEGLPKVLDFGLARLVNRSVGSVALSTVAGEVSGTVPYMSPEQIEGASAQVDERTDVYGLGVLLFELLTRRLPNDLASLSLPEAARVILTEPAERLARTAPEFSGDLDTIVAKALEKDPSDRYPSVAAFADDVTRFRRREPIQARPPSRLYMARRFAARNKALVGGVLSSLTILSGAVLLLAIVSVGATRDRDVAERKSAQAEAVNEYLLKVLGSANPGASGGARGREVRVVDVLDEAARELEWAFPEDPLVEAEVRLMVGRTYESLSIRLDDARRELLEARSLFRQHGGDPAKVVRASLSLLQVHEGVDREEMVEGLRTLLAEAEAELGEEHLMRFEVLAVLGAQLFFLSRREEAVELLNTALHEAREYLGPEHELTLRMRGSLIGVTASMGKLEEALAMAEEHLRLRRELGAVGRPAALTERINYYRLHGLLSGPEVAERHARELLADMERVYGPTGEPVRAVRRDLAQMLCDQQKFAEALSETTRLLAIIDGLEGGEDAVDAGQRLPIELTHSELVLETGDLAGAQALSEDILRRARDEDIQFAGRWRDTLLFGARLTLARVDLERGNTEAARAELSSILREGQERLLPSSSILVRCEELLDESVE